jgi:hypothetical protein
MVERALVAVRASPSGTDLQLLDRNVVTELGRQFEISALRWRRLDRVLRAARLTVQNLRRQQLCFMHLY